MSAPHEFSEDVDDYSMCVCGVPGDQHWRVEPGVVGQEGESRG